MVEEQVDEFLRQSETYEEALRKARSQSLVFKNGAVGRAIDNLVREEIKYRALKNSTTKKENEKWNY